MSIAIQYDPYGDYERTLNVEMLQTQMFGAFFAAIEYRKNNVNLTNAEIARRSGWSRSHITKIMAQPQNWTIETIARMATALDLEVSFILVDRTDRTKGFNANGIVLDSPRMFSGRGRRLKMADQTAQPNLQTQTSNDFNLVFNVQGSAPIRSALMRSAQVATSLKSAYTEVQNGFDLPGDTQ